MTGWPGKVRCRSFSICKFQSLLEGCHPAPTLLLSSLEAPSADQHASSVMSGLGSRPWPGEHHAFMACSIWAQPCPVVCLPSHGVMETVMHAAVCIRLPCQVILQNIMMLTMQLPILKWHAISDMHCTNICTAVTLRNHVAMCSMWSLAAKLTFAASDASSALDLQGSGNIVVIAFCLHLNRLKRASDCVGSRQQRPPQ